MDIKVNDKVWIMVCGNSELVPEEVEVAYIEGEDIVVRLNSPNFSGRGLSVINKDRVYTEKPIPERVKQLKGIIQSVSEATQGEYQDDYFCTKLAEQLYYEGKA